MSQKRQALARFLGVGVIALLLALAQPVSARPKLNNLLGNLRARTTNTANKMRRYLPGGAAERGHYYDRAYGNKFGPIKDVGLVKNRGWSKHLTNFMKKLDPRGWVPGLKGRGRSVRSPILRQLEQTR